MPLYKMSLRRYVINLVTRKCRMLLFLVLCMVTMKLLVVHQTPQKVSRKVMRMGVKDGAGAPEGNISMTNSKTCSEKQNFVFIKCMKCAGTTMLGVLRRYGYIRDLNFVTPIGTRLYINWPFPLTKRDYRPSKRPFNILIDHAVYAEEKMGALMPSDTVYLTSIRHPLAQLRSTFNYFKIHQTAGLPLDLPDPMEVYFSDPQRYEAQYQRGPHTCMPDGFSLTKNIMSQCLGMPLGFPKGSQNISTDRVATQRYIDHIESKFSLVIIADYMLESLVLLKRLMCWKMSDIVFVSMNVLQYGYKTTPMKPQVEKVHRQWSSIDYRLYDHFNTSLWRRIRLQGEGFGEEVASFRAAQEQVSQYCWAIRNLRDSRQVPLYLNETKVKPSSWNDQFSITPRDCFYLSDPYGHLQQIQKESDARDADLLRQQESQQDTRTMKGLC